MTDNANTAAAATAATTQAQAPAPKAQAPAPKAAKAPRKQRKAKAQAAPAAAPLANKLQAKVYTTAPQARMAATISTKGCKPMPANGPSASRWPLYPAGTSLYTAATTAGMCVADIQYWAKCGYCTIEQPTQAQVQAMLAHWHKATKGNVAA